MNLKNFKLLPGILVFLIFISSCKKDKMYIVPSNIQTYLDDFISEAAARGIDLNIDDLIVVFEDSLDVDGVDAAGLCQYGGKNTTPTIKLDTTSVNWRINLSSREQLVFHELGHCILNRSHSDSKMANNNYKTTMRPSGEQIYGPVYTYFKRAYYLDELFNIATPSPDWALNVPEYNDIAMVSKELIFQELFNNASGGWNVGSSGSTSRKIENGNYVLDVLQPGGFFIGNDLEIAAGEDFELELLVSLAGNGFGGMLWGGGILEDTTNTPSYKLMYFGNGVVSVGSFYNGTESSYQADQIDAPAYNKLTIRKIGNNVMHYFNENLIDNIRIDEPIGNKIGLPFGGEIGVQVKVDEIKLYYIN